MKRIIFVVLALLLLVFSLFGMFSAPAAHANLYSHAIPFSLSCFDDGGSGSSGCDGFKPPPISACQNDQSTKETSEIFASDGKDEGTLYVFYSSSVLGCYSAWGAFFAKDSVTVDAIGIWETGTGCGDGSNYGGLDSMPHHMVSGNWESTFMVGDCFHGANVQSCYHASMYLTDHLGVRLPIKNTNSFCD